MSDELLQAEGRVLHGRVSRGEVLTPPETERLEAYYAQVEAMYPIRQTEDAIVRLQERNEQLKALIAREEQFLARLRELYAERQVLNSERSRLLTV
jgi:hypothetical protein